jgi:mannitol/fructose-specific phosphotransferase system IIA component (Ntr-type)
MGLKKSLDIKCIRINPESEFKDDLLREISQIALGSSILKGFESDYIYNLLKTREKLSTTGIGMGIAIPHCSIEGLKGFVVGLIISERGLNFDSLDGKPTTLIFFIIGPKEKRNDHIQILSSISKLGKSPDIIKNLSSERSVDRVYESLTVNETESGAEHSHKDKCIFNVFIQNEDVFDDILEIFSAENDVAISVTETRNAGYYLHTMPLFSTFWSNDNRTFSRVVTAVVDKSSSNDIIRRINMLSDTNSTVEEVMITVQDLFYTSGGISF